MEPPEYRVPPTHPVYPSSGGYEPTQSAPPRYYDIPPIPPPPPPEPRARRRAWRWAFVITLLLFLGGAAAFAEWASIQPVMHASAIPTPTVSPTQTLEPTIDPHYTAMDIVQHMQAIDKTVGIWSKDVTIWTWSHNNYYTSVHATSSIQFAGCPEECADIHHFGLWVYASSQEAMSASQQVLSDSLACTDTTPSYQGMYVACGVQEEEYAHGRCLLLNTVQSSIYGQVVTRYCV